MPIIVSKLILLMSPYFGEKWDNFEVGCVKGGWPGAAKYTLAQFRCAKLVVEEISKTSHIYNNMLIRQSIPECGFTILKSLVEIIGVNLFIKNLRPELNIQIDSHKTIHFNTRNVTK